MKAQKVMELLKQVGELMVQVDGQVFELHLHNTTYEPELDAIKIDGATETYWIFGENIQFAWIHKKAKD
ncbi:MAG: hypothetical protein GXN92_00180 [Candidatus Micrarchaeota archaeon]|nr:hypothetical protein [Candidatus Micrarchaeota archaeon]